MPGSRSPMTRGRQAWRGRARAALCATLLGFACVLGASPAVAAITEAELAALRDQRDTGSAELRANLAAAINRLEASDPPARIVELIWLFGDVRFAEGASASALPAVEAGLRLARQLDDASRTAALEALAGQMQFALTHGQAARERIEHALAEQRRAGNVLELARQLSAYSSLLQEVDEFAAAMRLNNEAMSLLGEGQKAVTPVTFGVLYGRVELLRAIGEASAAVAAGETLLQRAATSGNAELIGLAQFALARASLAAGIKSRAAQLLEASYQQAVRFDDTLGRFLVGFERARLALDGEQLDVAREWLDRIKPLRDELDDGVLRFTFDVVDARVAARQGRTAQARSVWSRARSELPAQPGEAALTSQLRLAEAELLAAEGRPVEAVATYRDALRLTVESERQGMRNVIAAQSELYRLNERDYREQQLQHEARLKASQLEAAEQRLINQRLLVSVVALAALLTAVVAVWQLQRARHFRRRAEIDGLTGALSRTAILAEATARFQASQIEGTPYSLLLLDVDGLKPVNDRFGHARGDDLLREVSLTIARCLRDGDRLGRWGGDEFVVLLDRSDANAAQQARDRIGQELTASLAAAGFVGGSCSVGVATATPDDADFATVLARADVALYDAKPASRDRKPDHGPIENPPSAPHS